MPNIIFELEGAERYVDAIVNDLPSWERIDNHNGTCWTNDFEEVTISSPVPGLFFLDCYNIEITRMHVARFPIPIQFEKFKKIVEALELFK